MAMTLNQEETQRVNNVYNEREQALAENNQLYGDLMNQAGDLKNQQNAYLAEQQKTQNDIFRNSNVQIIYYAYCQKSKDRF